MRYCFINVCSVPVFNNLSFFPLLNMECVVFNEENAGKQVGELGHQDSISIYLLPLL